MGARYTIGNVMRKLRTYTITHHHIALTTLGLAAISLILAILVATRLHAESYDVTATVPAALPSTPAFITSPTDQEHVTDSPITVSGTCPPNSYVTIYRDGVLSGMASCISNTFSLQVSLVPGANELLAKVYNITNNEGPASPPITVYYDVVTPPTPPVPHVTGLGVDFVETTPYQPGIIYRTSKRPTISGHAPVGSTVTITFGNSSFTCKTEPDTSGQWVCTLADTLADGTYEVQVSATTPQETTLTVSPFYIVVSSAVPNLIPPMFGTPLSVTCLCVFQSHKPGEEWQWNIIINGGTPPYTMTIDWDDGITQSIPNSETHSVIKHAYNKPRDYIPFVTVRDSAGNQAVLQLYAPVVGELTDIGQLPTFGFGNIPLSAAIVFMPPVIGAAFVMVLGLRKLLLFIISKLT